MEDVAAANTKSAYRQIEFYAFCVVSFSAKSLLLIGLPYREWPVNTVYTCSLLLFFYCFFRFRQNLRAPMLVVYCLAAAVAVECRRRLEGRNRRCGAAAGLPGIVAFGVARGLGRSRRV